MALRSIQSAEAEHHARKTQLELLRQKASHEGYDVLSNVAYDGDCLFSSILKLFSGAAWDSNQLRKNLFEYLSKEEVRN